MFASSFAHYVIALEPAPMNYEKIKNRLFNLKRNNIIVLKYAACSYNGKALLFLRSPSTHSMVKKSGRAIEIRCIRLDTLIEKILKTITNSAKLFLIVKRSCKVVLPNNVGYRVPWL